jgi:hypothetical protein
MKTLRYVSTRIPVLLLCLLLSGCVIHRSYDDEEDYAGAGYYKYYPYSACAAYYPYSTCAAYYPYSVWFGMGYGSVIYRPYGYGGYWGPQYYYSSYPRSASSHRPYRHWKGRHTSSRARPIMPIGKPVGGSFTSKPGSGNNAKGAIARPSQYRGAQGNRSYSGSRSYSGPRSSPSRGSSGRGSSGRR